MDSKTYKVIGVLAIIASVVLGAFSAYVEVPAITMLDYNVPASTEFSWKVFLSYSLLGFIGGFILIGIGNLTEDLASIDTTQRENFKRTQKNACDTSPSQTSTSHTHTSNHIQKSRYCQVCGDKLPPTSTINLCRTCFNKK